MKQNSDHDKGLLKPAQGAVSWESPANIAIVKYWGKYPVQLPMNPSLSFVLKNSVVRVRMEYRINPGDHFSLDHFSINGHQNDAFKKRIAGYLEGLAEYFPFLKHSRLRIQSTSTFPHSAGIASSAAAFSALALCLCSIDSEILQWLKKPVSTRCSEISWYLSTAGKSKAAKKASVRSIHLLYAPKIFDRFPPCPEKWLLHKACRNSWKPWSSTKGSQQITCTVRPCRRTFSRISPVL